MTVYGYTKVFTKIEIKRAARALRLNIAQAAGVAALVVGDCWRRWLIVVLANSCHSLLHKPLSTDVLRRTPQCMRRRCEIIPALSCRHGFSGQGEGSVGGIGA